MSEARLKARIEAAANWLMSDDSGYENEQANAYRAAREMLAAADAVDAIFTAAAERAIAILSKPKT